jgi:2-hydroxymuconate-semialdehyde hydrolase
MAIREHDLSFEGIPVHCYEGGSGFPIVLIHGSGPGTSSSSNWGKVLAPLSERYHVCAMDLVGYGLSGRKPKEPYFDLDLWARQVRFALARISPTGPVGLIGHSLGGSISLRAAFGHKRLSKLMLQGSMGHRTKVNTAMRVSWTAPKDEAAFRKFYRDIIKVKGEVSDAFIRERLRIVRKDGYDKYFNKMFAGDKQRYIDRASYSKAKLKTLKCEVLLVHGSDDTCIPFEEGAVPLAKAIPQADLVRIANAGHPCSLDMPEKFLAYATSFFG